MSAPRYPDNPTDCFSNDFWVTKLIAKSGVCVAISQPLLTARRSIPGVISPGEANADATRFFRFSEGSSDRFHREKPTAHIAELARVSEDGCAYLAALAAPQVLLN